MSDNAILLRVFEAMGHPGMIPNDGRARYLHTYDIEAHDGRGAATVTADYTKAVQFASSHEALAAWRAQSKTRPTRADGKPNRPLTALSVELMPLSAAKALAEKGA